VTALPIPLPRQRGAQMHLNLAKYKPISVPRRGHRWILAAMIAVFLVVVLW
jgi:hypothetical protein